MQVEEEDCTDYHGVDTVERYLAVADASGVKICRGNVTYGGQTILSVAWVRVNLEV